MTTSVRMAAMSHLSDAQQIMKADAKLASQHIDFAKALLLKYSDLDQEVAYRELDDLWLAEIQER